MIKRIASIAVAAAGLSLFAVVAEEPRPKVGVVLGGGGALGFSHIGVLKVLEEHRIPVDYIVGTSMGSIIAGLYASGMAPDEIHKFLDGLNWDEVMSDKTPRRELFYRRKLEDQRYLVEMGFKRSGFAFGSGMAAGQKFNNLMQFATLRAASVTDFDQLPIPYRAVATDLASGEKFVIDGGSLATAMRASMAVPGVFTPVTIDGHVLVDGGIVDNLPVDVVREMGAEVIIAVDVGSAADVVDEASFSSLGGVLGRTYTIAQRPEQMEMFRQADVGIQPPLAGFTASQFSRVSEFVPRGEQGAREKTEALSRYSVSEEEYAKFLQRQRRPHPDSIRIAEVIVSGNQRVSADVIKGRIRTKPGVLFNPKEVERDLMRVYGIGEFEQVLCRITPSGGDAHAMDFHVKEKAWGPTYFKYGLQLRSNFEDDSDWRMLVNFTRMSVNRLGAEWRNELQLGSTREVLSEFYQPLDSSGLFFAAPSLEYQSEPEDVYEDKQRVAEYDVTRRIAYFDLGVQLRRYAELRVGPYVGKGEADVQTGSTDLPELDEDLGGWRVKLTVDRQDRTLFAREGYYVQAEASLAREEMGGDREYDKVQATARKFLTFGNHTFSPGFRVGSALGDELPEYAQFTLGGPFDFAGLNEDQFRGSYEGVASLGYIYRIMTLPSQLGRGVYAILRLDHGNVWEEEIETDDTRTGVAAGIGADSVMGPIYVAYGQADGGYSTVYFSLGTSF